MYILLENDDGDMIRINMDKIMYYGIDENNEGVVSLMISQGEYFSILTDISEIDRMIGLIK